MSSDAQHLPLLDCLTKVIQPDLLLQPLAVGAITNSSQERSCLPRIVR